MMPDKSTISPLPNARYPHLQGDSQVTIYAVKQQTVKRSDYTSDVDWEQILRRFRVHEQADKKEVVIIPVGMAKKVYRVDAREHIRTKAWSLEPPGRAMIPPPKPSLADLASSFRLSQIPGIGATIASRLTDAGFNDVYKWLEDGADEKASEVDGVGAKYAKIIGAYVVEHYGGLAGASLSGPVATEEEEEVQ